MTHVPFAVNDERVPGPHAVPATGASHSPGDAGEQLRNFVCWSPTRVASVMDTEALQTDPEVFLATHSRMPLLRAGLSGEGAQDSALTPYTERAFLAEFLASDDYAFVAVLGGAGTGKSHLVRWLSTQIVESPSRRVLLIPRAGTSLHEILRRLLAGLEGERFVEYRRRLDTTDNSMNVSEARERLLDNLALALRQDVQRAEAVGEPVADDEMEEYCITELPNLLGDPVFRPHFLRPGGVLDRLASHVLGHSEVERVEERRGFTVVDLPIDAREISRASAPAQDVVRMLNGHQAFRPAAVTCLNRYLDQAVTQLLRMSGTDLIRLMRDVRVELATKGVELVILIEDLATLQGVDQQLLEALIVRPRQEGMDPLCAMRAAVGMTRGYYDGLRPNVRQRFDFRVVMGEGDTRANATSEDVLRFTAHYFNAARVGGSELRDWYLATLGGDVAGQEREPAPSACTACQYKPECHRAFGARDGMGLYPLNENAVAAIAARVSPTGFNPRIQLKEAYKPLLEGYADTLEEGRFPPIELHKRFGVSRLRADVSADLQRLDAKDFGRREALLDLWGGAPREVVNLDPVIHRAFSLPPLDRRGTVSTDASPVDTPPIGADDPGTDRLRESTIAPAGSPIDARLRAQLDELDRWRGGDTMSQDLMQELRIVVYPAVMATIDWNASHLLPSDIGSAFKQAQSINFARQLLQQGRAAVQLVLPLRDEDIATTAVALQGLLQLRYYRTWQFTSGQRFYRAYLRQVKTWADHVLAQLRHSVVTKDGWDPVPVAAELLAVGARLHGLPRVQKNRMAGREDTIEALFSELPDRVESGRSDAWTALAKRFRNSRPTIRRALLARIACSKGNSAQVQFVDIARVLPTADAVRRGQLGKAELPAAALRAAAARTWERAIADCGAELGMAVAAAAAAEQAHQCARYDVVVRALGVAQDAPVGDVVDARDRAIASVRRLVDRAVAGAVLPGRERREAVLAACDAFAAVQLRAWAERVDTVRRRDPTDPSLLVDLSLIPLATGETASDFVRTVESALADVDRVLRHSAEGDAGEALRRMEQVMTGIRDGLLAVGAALSKVDEEER